MRNSTFGPIGHHLRLGDDDLLLSQSHDDGLADFQHHVTENDQADMQDEGGDEGQDILNERLLPEAFLLLLRQLLEHYFRIIGRSAVGQRSG